MRVLLHELVSRDGALEAAVPHQIDVSCLVFVPERCETAVVGAGQSDKLS